MKRFLIPLCLVAASSTVFAAGKGTVTYTDSTTHQLCDGSIAGGGKTAVNGGSGAVPTTVPVFTRTGFDVQCSNNVFLSVQETDATLAVVSSGSAKGDQYFAGSSNGGAVTAINKCTGTNSSCSDTDINSGITAAITNASSN